MDKVRSAAKRFGGFVLTVLAFLQIVEVPAQVAILRSWAEGIDREHIAWVMMVAGLVWTVLGNLDWILRRVPEGWLPRSQRGHGPASFVHFDRPYPIIDRNGWIGFGFRVFNGNQASVSFVLARCQLTYDDRLIPAEHVNVDAPAKGIPAAEHSELLVLIELRGPVSDEIKADIGQGKLKPIGLDGLHLLVKDARGRTEKAALPKAIDLHRQEPTWIAGRHLGSLFVGKKLSNLIETRTKLEPPKEGDPLPG